jgi:hypothetical protein
MRDGQTRTFRKASEECGTRCFVLDAVRAFPCFCEWENLGCVLHPPLT